MPLEKRYTDVRQALFDTESFIKDGVLHINQAELENYLEDPRLEIIRIEIAHPNESCRLTNVGDIVQPMFKPETKSAFSGVTDDIRLLGEGSTCVVRGVAVIEVLQIYARGVYFEMSGQGTEFTPLSGNIMIAINGYPTEGTEKLE